MFIYETSRVSVRIDQGAPNFDPLRCNATKVHMEHYQNLLVLDHIAKHGTIHEKAQAEAEIEICKRKMKYWERQPHFNADLAREQKHKLHRRMAA